MENFHTQKSTRSHFSLAVSGTSDNYSRVYELKLRSHKLLVAVFACAHLAPTFSNNVVSARIRNVTINPGGGKCNKCRQTCHTFFTEFASNFRNVCKFQQNITIAWRLTALSRQFRLLLQLTLSANITV